jgi:hypothetical protein
MAALVHIEAHGLLSIRDSDVVWALFFLLLSVGAATNTRSATSERSLQLSVVVFVSLGLHYLVFPMFLDRFFVGHYAVLVVVACTQLLQSARQVGGDAETERAHEAAEPILQGKERISARTVTG